ncbi:hypothetical protein HFP57_05985 [Parasphingopyxis algicola]|uniref:hypothetical protein n=1 Tax=Parasphingopyxis algicola TaxID=2026624 RepID=UPI0015A42123|nr:hypothetical protein [Parasphingopyxis algicola]QLC24623.1 hypothetical protein HFP57_05985 [Parasphingopyxis algicola]
MTNDANVQLADDLWTRGAGHVLGVQALVDAASESAIADGASDVSQMTFNGRHSASIHLLVGFAFELLLKTAFLLHGGNSKDLGPSCIGHDLLTALDKAEEVGFQSNCANLRWFVENLREPHKKHWFRYGGPDSVTMPAIELTLPALDALAREVGADLRRVMGDDFRPQTG